MTDASTADLIANLAEPVRPVDSTFTSGELYGQFSDDPDLFCVPVVNSGRPEGLVNRHDLTLKLAMPYGRALYANRSVAAVMDRSPLVVDAKVRLDELGQLILTQRPNALLTGFIIVDGGRYLGIGTSLSMLRMRSDQTERRALELEAARREAEAANRCKTEFLANMSHELRTPLNAIIGYSEMLKMQLLGPLGHGSYIEYAQDIHRSGQHLLQLIGDILDLSKVEAGRMDLQITRVDPAELARDTLRMTGDTAHRCGVSLTASVDDTLDRIDADETKLRQVLLNLLSNAIKFTPRGGQVSLKVGATGDGGAIISVTDTGIGMSPEEIAVALEPFRQIESHMTRRFSGTGLGLPLTKALVELHGGRLEIRSRRAEGTQVIVRLPAPAENRQRLSA